MEIDNDADNEDWSTFRDLIYTEEGSRPEFPVQLRAPDLFMEPRGVYLYLKPALYFRNRDLSEVPAEALLDSMPVSGDKADQMD